MNPTDYLRTYDIPELERIAHEELRKLHSITIPVDIENLIEQVYQDKIEIDVKRGLKEHYNIWGMVGPELDQGKIIIFVDDQLLDLDHLYKIYRMTVAEEFAHILLHGKAIEKVKNIEDFKTIQNHPSWHEHDRNAKWLAAALLMPPGYILDDSRKLYKQLVSTASFGDPTAIKKYIRNLLADKYHVSVSSMEYRLANWPVNVMDKIDQAMQDKLDFLD